MTEPNNNPPARIVELSEEQYQFLLNNCEVNIGAGLAALQELTSRDLQERCVSLLEAFKDVRKALQSAK